MRRRFALVFALIALVAISGVLRSAHTAASTGDMAAHPFVGTWLIDTDTTDPTNLPDLIVVHGDGTYIESGPNGEFGAGSWQATGDSTADLTIWFPQQDDKGAYSGALVVRAAVTIAGDGQSFTADYTLELIDATGSGTGQYGPTHAMATKLRAEPMGTPVGPASALFGGEGGTPEASPAP